MEAVKAPTYGTLSPPITGDGTGTALPPIEEEVVRMIRMTDEPLESAPAEEQDDQAAAEGAAADTVSEDDLEDTDDDEEGEE